MSAESIRRTRVRPDRVHYRHNGVEVTSRHLTVRSRRYDIDELADIMVVRWGTHPGVKIGAAAAIVEAAALVLLARFGRSLKNAAGAGSTGEPAPAVPSTTRPAAPRPGPARAAGPVPGSPAGGSAPGTARTAKPPR